MSFNEVLFPRKRSPFPKRGRHSLSPSERVTHSAERVPPSPLGKVSAQPTEEVRFPLWGRCRRSRRKRSAFPFGEGGGAADGRGLCLPLWGEWHAVPREVTAFPFGESGTQRRERSAFPFGESGTQCRERSAFPFGEGGGAADGRGPPPLLFLFLF